MKYTKKQSAKLHINCRCHLLGKFFSAAEKKNSLAKSKISPAKTWFYVVKIIRRADGIGICLIFTPLLWQISTEKKYFGGIEMLELDILLRFHCLPKVLLYDKIYIHLKIHIPNTSGFVSFSEVRNRLNSPPTKWGISGIMGSIVRKFLRMSVENPDAYPQC